MVEGARGSSLIELIVSLGILAVLATGLLRFQAACLRTLARACERVEMRQGLRRAMDQLSDDLQEAGFLVPCRTLPEAAPVTLGRNRCGSAELGLWMDEPLAAQGFLCADLAVDDPVPLSRRVRLQAGGPVSLGRGDVILVEDGAWEGLWLEGNLELLPGVTGEAIVATPAGEIPREHRAGAPVTFLRPWRRVAWSLEKVRGGGPGADLVRSESGGSGAPGRRRVVASRVNAFHVDLPGWEGGGIPPLVVVTLEAQGLSGRRCSLTLARAPRNGVAP